MTRHEAETEYTCAVCKEIFPKVNDENWSDEKAMEEMNDKGLAPPPGLEHELAVVCDECYKKVFGDA